MAKVPAEPPVPPEVAAGALPSDGDELEVSHSTNTNRRGLKRNENQPGCWVQGGTIFPFKSVERAMADIAETRKVELEDLSGKVERIRATRVRRESSIYLYPVPSTDPDGMEVTRSAKSGRLSMNLFDYLSVERLLIPVGRKQRFDLTYVTKAEAPAVVGGDALRLDFAKPLEEKLLPKRPPRSKKKSTPPTPPTGPQTTPPQPQLKTDAPQAPAEDNETK